MPVYAYKATDFIGKTIEGSMEAQGEKAVVERLHSLGYIPVRISLPRDEDAAARPATWGQFKSVTTADVLSFTQELHTLLNAGFPIDRSLAVLTELAEKPRLREITQEILTDVESGDTLAKALGKHPQVFSRLYINMVLAGEAGGFLPKALDQIITYLQGVNELKNYIVSAMIYPVILSAVSGISVVILLTFVIPRFAQIFGKTGVPLPAATQILLASSDFIRNYWWAILGTIIGAYWALKAYTADEERKLKWDKWKLEWIFVGGLIKKMEAGRFCRTLGTLIRSGIPILTAISIARETLENSIMRYSMESVYEQVKEGGRIAPVLKKDNFFPTLAIHMVSVGEESGDLDGMLLNIAATLENQVRTDIKRLVNLLEPAMILFMGLTVGFIVLSMLLAIFSVNEISF